MPITKKEAIKSVVELFAKLSDHVDVVNSVPEIVDYLAILGTKKRFSQEKLKRVAHLMSAVKRACIQFNKTTPRESNQEAVESMLEDEKIERLRIE